MNVMYVHRQVDF